MEEKVVKKLENIKKEILEGTYRILQKPQWDEFANDLSNCGATLLKDIEKLRDKLHKIKIPLFFFRAKEQLDKFDSEYDTLAKNYDLFFDASMRWLKAIVDGNIYNERQQLTRRYVENLVDHCSKASDYLGNLITSNRNDYYRNQTLLLAITAIVIAIISIIIR